jgi:CRISPR/Cas system-associated exonuclease Cas4 (RecB family)
LPLDGEGAVEWRGIPLQVIRKLPDPQPSPQKVSLLQTHGPRLLAETGGQDTSVFFTAVKAQSEKPLRLNVSELLAFRSCGRRYFWKYRLCLTEPLLPQGNRPEKPAGLGVAIGDFFHRAVRAGGIEWPENLWDGFRREMGLDEASAPKLQGDLRRIWGHYQGSRFTGQGGECWQEVPFVVKLGEKLHIEGRLDRLLQTKDGKLILVDFKTHRHIANIVDTSEAYFWQLQLYALDIKALWGRLPDEAILYFLFSDTEVLVPLDENALNKTIAAIKENTALIGGGELLLDFPAATDCSGCGYQLFCNSSGGSSSS